MLRGLLNRVTGGGRRRPAGGPAGPGSRSGAASANRDIERGAKSILRGLKKRR